MMERAPEELFPIMPPMVARLLGETSGANQRPWGPGWMRAQRSSTFTSRIVLRYLDMSNWTARPTAWPARAVPAPRGRTGTPCRPHISTAAMASSGVLGITTPRGSIS